MINITCANGITTVVNTDYNVMPVVKFVNGYGSYISEAKGMYNGHYYWVLNGLAQFGGLPEAGDVYIWFNTSETEWWATNELGGGIFYDQISLPTNTLYPIEAFLGGSFDAGTLISPANGLAKSYFNINGKFHTKETTFYIYLANDVYEIPLAKLQVNGSPQATMQDGINALAAILVNAGASGGGGTVVSDNITILGNGTIATPLTSFVKYHVDQQIINEPGVYVYTNSFAGSGSIVFNELPYTYGDQIIHIINLATTEITFSGVYLPYYEGTNTQINSIQAYSTLTVHWNTFEGENRIINPNFYNCISVNLDAYGNNYPIFEANTLYRITSNSAGYELFLPDPINYRGKQLIINNRVNSLLGYNGSFGYQPIDPAGVTVTSIDNRTTHTLISDGGSWLITNILSV